MAGSSLDGTEVVDVVDDAASVLLLRQAPAELEVFVVERRKAGAFAGVLAFPGGKVDHGDRVLHDSQWRGLDLVATTDRWGLDPASPEDRAKVLGWHVAAVREVFEEVGVLLAGRPTGPALGARDLARPSFFEARAHLVERGAPWDWSGWLRDEDLVLDLGALRAWSRWVTPVGEPRRFDTAFFLADLPAAQAEALAHDEVEVVASRWVSPQAMLQERADGTSVIIYPTRRQVVDLPTDVPGALTLAAARDLRAVQPTIQIEDDGTIVAHHPFDGTVEPVF